MNNTIISWSKVTWNPTHGCSRVSEGCRHCYAEQLSLKRGWTTQPWTGANATANVTLKPHKLNEPLKLKEPSKVFVNSMSDLFHENIPDEYIRQIFDVMNQCPQHTFQILTKRAERAAAWDYGWSDHIWMGVSVEDQRATSRIDLLRDCPAHVRFISAEPLIEEWTTDLTGIDWLIVGGESGQGFRSMPHAWARNLRDQCLSQNVAFFFKQSAAFRTEMGTSLQHEDGSFWMWQQFPDNRQDPVIGEAHKYTYETLPTQSLLF